MQNPLQMFSDMYAVGLWVVVWVGWLLLIQMASVLFLKEPEGKYTLASLMASGAFMMTQYSLTGYTNLLGLGHIVFWFPLVIYLLKRHREWERDSKLNIWLNVLVISLSLSLIIDFFTVGKALLQ